MVTFLFINLIPLMIKPIAKFKLKIEISTKQSMADLLLTALASTLKNAKVLVFILFLTYSNSKQNILSHSHVS